MPSDLFPTDVRFLARKALEDIASLLERMAPADLDSDHEEERLTIKVQAGTFLLNVHDTARQIWLSSPLTGAHHFTLCPERMVWLSTRNHTLELQAFLWCELGETVSLPELRAQS